MTNIITDVDSIFQIEEEKPRTGIPDTNKMDKVNQPKVMLSKSKFTLIILGLVLSMFVSALDNTIIATSLSNIANDLNAFNQLFWISTSYFLSSTAFQPLYGKFSDIFGRRLVMLFALGIFLVGSILCGVSQNVIMLIISRAIAGIGGGGLISLSVIIISDIVAIERRGLYMGLVGANFAVASVVGPLIGGALTEKASWRWCFYINIPICLIAMFVIGFFLRLPNSKENMKQKLARVDYLGTSTLLIGTCLFVLGLNWGGQEYPWNSTAVIITITLGLTFLCIFAFFQWKVSKEPIIPAHVLVNNVISADLIAFFSGAVNFTTVFYLPLYYQIIQQKSVIDSGLELLAPLSGIVICSIFSGIFISKTGIYRPLSMTGSFIGLLGTVLMGSLMRDDITKVELVIFPLMIGSGVGLCVQTNIIISQAAVETKDAAIVTSMAAFCQSLGGIIGMAILGTVFKNVLTSSLIKSVPGVNIDLLLQSSTYIQTLSESIKVKVIESYVLAFKYMFLSGIALFSICFISSLFLKHISLKKFASPVQTSLK